jgi:8-amino-7-oxononanoate synthase
VSFSASARLKTLESDNRLRRLRAVTPHHACRVQVDGHWLSLFSSNDYLGLSAHPMVKEAIMETAKEWGMGPRGAALICGYTPQHEALEQELALLKGTESALLFPTGFQANLGLLSALGGKDTAFFSDALNHASIIDGIRLSKSPVHVYRHGDMEHLRELIRRENVDCPIIVTDALFSMEGTLAPLEELVRIKEETGALLIVDEAHSTLVYGENGGGLAEQEGVADRIDFHVGTLSKAFGCQGGFIATHRKRREWLLNVARSYVFTTAMPLPLVAGARAALGAWSSALQGQLWERVHLFEGWLGRSLAGPIIPIVLHEEERALKESESLWTQGFHVPAIRPPTVPQGTSRLRVALSAGHSMEEVERLIHSLNAALGTPSHIS